MPSRRRRSSLPVQLAELGLAAPQVVAHRLWRLAAAGVSPSARDRREFARMVHEKTAAFGEAWWAMAWQAVHLQQALWLSWWSAGPLAATQPGAKRALERRLRRGARSIAASGLAPVHRVAVANARRLARTTSR